jgi:hypothetical protein
MFGRRSLSLPLFLSDLDIERAPRRLRSKRNSRRRVCSKGQMAKGPRPLLLRDHYVPSTYTPSSCLQLPNIMAAQYEIKSSIIQMLPSFYGLSDKDPYKHLVEFIEICKTFPKMLEDEGPFTEVSTCEDPLYIYTLNIS